MAIAMLETLALCATVILLVYYYLTSTFDFWKSRGVNGPKPVIYFGNTKDVLLGKESLSDLFAKLYREYKDEPMVGIYGGRTPLLIIRDPEFIKTVLIKDFSNFPDRALPPKEKVEPLSLHLFRLDAARWRPLRNRLTPVFTSGKLKEMFHLLLECSEHFDSYLENLVAKGDPIECREVMAKFTTDVIGSCAFGIEINAMSSEESEFRFMGREIFKTNWRAVVRDRLREFPILFHIFGPLVVQKHLTDFFINITKEAIDYRIEHKVHRPDFVDALVELKQHPDKLNMTEISDGFLASQSFVFFAAGFETSSMTIAHAIYELAQNHVVQERVRKEIQDVLRETDGKITYESIKSMTYLHAVFQETLRKYPPVLYLSRTAMKSYTFPGTKVTVPKGQQIFIPVYAIHHDPNIYPDPEVFDPERFIGDVAKSRHLMNFLPFGDGPRNCIGARFANYQTKVGIIMVLSKFKVDVCEKTVIPYKLNPKTLFLLQPTHDIHVKMTKLNY